MLLATRPLPVPKQLKQPFQFTMVKLIKFSRRVVSKWWINFVHQLLLKVRPFPIISLYRTAQKRETEKKLLANTMFWCFSRQCPRCLKTTVQYNNVPSFSPAIAALSCRDWLLLLVLWFCQWSALRLHVGRLNRFIIRGSANREVCHYSLLYRWVSCNRWTCGGRRAGTLLDMQALCTSD